MNGHISFCGAFEAKCFMGAVENIFEQKYLSLREGLLIPDIILCVCVLSGPQQPHSGQHAATARTWDNGQYFLGHSQALVNLLFLVSYFSSFVFC